MNLLLKNSQYLFLAVLLMVFVGFWRTYFGLFPGFAGLRPVLHLHALSALLWFACLIAQPILIRRGQIGLHRQVGRASYGIVVVMLATMSWLIAGGMARPVVAAESIVDTSMIGIADMTFFGLCYGLALYFRRRTALHARYMVMTVLPFINPALGRLGFPGPLLALAFLVAMLAYERFGKRVYRPWLLGLVAYLGIYSFFLFVITRSDWLGFWARVFS